MKKQKEKQLKTKKVKNEPRNRLIIIGAFLVLLFALLIFGYSTPKEQSKKLCSYSCEELSVAIQKNQHYLTNDCIFTNGGVMRDDIMTTEELVDIYRIKCQKEDNIKVISPYCDYLPVESPVSIMGSSAQCEQMDKEGFGTCCNENGCVEIEYKWMCYE